MAKVGLLYQRFTLSFCFVVRVFVWSYVSVFTCECMYMCLHLCVFTRTCKGSSCKRILMFLFIYVFVTNLKSVHVNVFVSHAKSATIFVSKHVRNLVSRIS